MASEKYEKAKEQAMAGYLDPGPDHLNCAQAVMLCGLLAMEQDPDLISYAAFFGGGMARMGEVCGALSGAALTLAVYERIQSANGVEKPVSHMDWLQQLVRDFEAKFGSPTCRGLLGCDISTPEGFREAKKSQVTKRCPEFVSWTCDRLAEVLAGPREETA